MSGVLFGYFNGDFNLDGLINIDDYGIIDFNIGIQGPPFPTAGGIEGVAAVAAVPEPASFAAISLMTAGVLARRRKSLRRRSDR